MTAADERTTEPGRDESAEEQASEGQISEAGGALGDGEAALNGADAVPDKPTGTAGDNRPRS